MNSIVKTKYGYKVYPKTAFSFDDIYVDMNKMSFLGLRKHPNLFKTMVLEGDTELLPGGQHL
ncbi:MAG: hypothetical protein ROO71_02825 [Balneola sp.]